MPVWNDSVCRRQVGLFVVPRYSSESDRGVQLFREFGFDQGGDLAAPACLLKGELAVLPAALAVCFPLGLVCLKFGFDAVGRVRQMSLVEFAFPYGDDVPRDGFEPLGSYLILYFDLSYLSSPLYHYSHNNFGIS